MSKMDEKNKPSGTPTAPIVIASIASLGWVSLAVFLGMNASPDHRIWPLANLSANEWGDFLAGVAGTLAFIWLIATVLIQAKELRLQRTEMEDNREVATEQARYIGEQTNLLQQESKERRNMLALQQINAASDRIENILSLRIFSGLKLYILVNTARQELFPEAGHLDFGHRIRIASDRLRMHKSAEMGFGQTFVFEHFIDLNDELGRWQRFSENLDSSYLPLRKNGAEIEMLLKIVETLLEAYPDMAKDVQKSSEIGRNPTTGKRAETGNEVEE